MFRQEFWTILSRIMGFPAVAPALASRRGKDVFVPRSASLPASCIKCGASATKPWRQKFYWHSPWLYLLIFLNLLIYAIVALIVRKQMELNLPLCDAHHQDRKRNRLMALIMILGAIPVGIALGTMASEALGWITGVLMFLASVVFYVMSGLGVRATKIDENGGVFRGACAKFLDLLPAQP